MHSFTQAGKRWLLAAATAAGLWSVDGALAPEPAEAQFRRPGLGLPQSDDGQRQREEERKREEEKRAEERRQEEPRRQEESRRQEQRQQEQARNAERERQEQQRRQEAEQRREQQRQEQQESLRRQQERQEQQRRQESELRQRQQQEQQEAQRRRQDEAKAEERRRQQEQAQAEAARRQEELSRQAAQERERLAQDTGSRTGPRRPSLFGTRSPAQPPPSTPPVVTPPANTTPRESYRAPSESGRPTFGRPSPPSNPGSTPEPSWRAAPQPSLNRRPSLGVDRSYRGGYTPPPAPPVIINPAPAPSQPPAVVPPAQPGTPSRPSRGVERAQPQDSPRAEQPALPGTGQRHRRPALFPGTPFPGGGGNQRPPDLGNDRGGSGDPYRDRDRDRGRDWDRGRGGRYAGGRWRHVDHRCDSRCRHGRHYEHRCDGSCRHRRYEYDGPYGPVYTPVYIPVPVPEPVIIYEPRTEVIVVPRAPEPEPVPPSRAPERPYDDRIAGPMPLDDVLANVERAWEESNLGLLMQHVAPEGEVEIFQQGELLYRLSRAEFRERNVDAFRQYRTLEMRLGRPELLSETEAVASGLHVFRDDTGEERRVRVRYAFRKQGRTWWLKGLDFSPEGVENLARSAAGSPVAEAAPGTAILNVSPLWTRKIRLSSLLAQAKPVRLATFRYRIGTDDATYDLEAMRGIVPNTVAWALYHRGEQSPIETGILETANLDPKSWFAFRVLPTAAAQPVLATSGGKRARAAALSLRWMADGQVLALHETTAPLAVRVTRPARKPVPTKAKAGQRARGAKTR